MIKGVVGLQRTRSSVFTLLSVTALVFSGCGAGDWFSVEEPPLKGERVSVLELDRQIEPDPRISDLEVTLPRPYANSEWPQAGGVPTHTMHHLALPNEKLERVWSRDIGQGSSRDSRLTASPVTGEGLIFAMDAESNVSAYSLNDGAEKWSVDLVPDNEDDDEATGGGIGYYQGKVYVADAFGYVSALDAKNGKKVWQKKFLSPFRAAPTISGGKVFALTFTSELHALNAENGEELWSYQGVAEDRGVLAQIAPAVGENVVIVPSPSGEVTALRSDTGGVLWSESLVTAKQGKSIAQLADIAGRPMVDRGVVYAVSNANKIMALDLQSGRRVWDAEFGGLHSPWLAGDYIFMLTNNAELVCVSRIDGKVRWVTALKRFEDEEDREDPIQWAGPVLASDRLIVTSSLGDALAVSPYTGKILGRIELPDGVLLSPIIAQGMLFVLTEEADLVAYK